MTMNPHPDAMLAGASRAATALTLVKSAAPLIVALLLQYSITGVAIFMVGSMGTKELAGVSLASMTANITGYAVFQGLATSLDTLCAQAYGAGRPKDVGLHVQRMMVLQALALVLVGAVWLNSEPILLAFIRDPEVVHIAAVYLKILLVGAPGWALFECAKRFLQAQDLFTATTYLLLVLAPLNVGLHWLLMFVADLGYIGSAISVVCTNLLLPVGAVIYVVFVDGSQCWCPFSMRVWQDWLPMVKMSFYGFVQIEAEWLSFEILTLAAGQLGRNELAVQGILISIGTYGSQVPIALSTAAAMLTGQLYGAGLVTQTRSAIHVAYLTALAQAVLSSLVVLLINPIISDVTSTNEVTRQLMLRSIPIIAAFQILDSFAQITSALLRAIGRQYIGLPLSFVLTFKTDSGLYGLWTGPGVSLIIICTVQLWVLSRANLEIDITPKTDGESEPLLRGSNHDGQERE